ncbi:MAG: hypothetical protein AAF573_08745 [Bacteroidota bacterium]
MKLYFLTCTLALCCLSFSSLTENYPLPTHHDSHSNSAATESSFYYVLDNRYQGGSDAFIALFEKNVSYPKEAFDNCRLGISKINLKISKAGKLENFEIQTQLGMGIEETLTDFFEKTKGNWKAWARSSEMDMTVGFSLITQKDSYYPDADLLVLEKSAFKWATDNEYCDPDAKILKRIKKYFKKKKYEKAKPHVEELIRRYPDSEEYKGFYTEVEKHVN